MEFLHDHEEHEHECTETHVGHADACHMALYHDEHAEECEDHSHLTEQHQDCTLCDMTVAQVWLFKDQSDLSPVSTFANDSDEYSYSSNHASTHIRLAGDRGPPAFS